MCVIKKPEMKLSCVHFAVLLNLSWNCSAFQLKNTSVRSFRGIAIATPFGVLPYIKQDSLNNIVKLTSLRRLERILHDLGLKRRRVLDIPRIRAAIMHEMSGSGQGLGCRSMIQRLLTRHGLSVGRDMVLHLMHAIDPDGVEMRSRHCLSRRQYSHPGPIFLIHIDGYDKLKRYEFAIHGAVCGFSRRVLWLTVGRTNNDPAVVASFYLKFVKEIEGKMTS